MPDTTLWATQSSAYSPPLLGRPLIKRAGTVDKTIRVNAQKYRGNPYAKVTVIEAEVAFKGDLTEMQIQRLGEISGLLPIVPPPYF
jgi:hypothetical protein